MKTTWQCLLVCAASALMGLCTHAQTQVRLQNVIQRAPDTNAQQLNCSGTVTDAAGSPVAGATVEYWRYEGRLNRLELKK
ncbi:MAG: hypothetical protein WBW41_17140 [Verrucomicrobiia bacterium]